MSTTKKVILTVLLFAFCVGWAAVASHEERTEWGAVVEKHYVAPSASAGVGVTTGGDVAIVSTSAPEKLLLLVEPEGDPTRIEVVRVKRHQYVAVDRGDRVMLKYESILGIPASPTLHRW